MGLTGPYVLIVEDDQNVAELLVRWTGALGHIGRVVRSSDDALLAIESTRPAAVITDLMMPERDGIWLAEAIHQRWPRLPVVVTSGSLLETERFTFAGVLEKPFTREAFVSALQTALTGARRAHH